MTERMITGVGLPGWRKQAATLSERYLDVMLGDLTTLLLLIAQAPIIAWLCVIVWSGVQQETKSLYFVLALSAIWFGCINACREIVKERALLERERLFGLSTLAYVVSKARILIAIDLVQVGLMLGIVEWKIALKGSLVWQSMSMMLCAAAGTGLGLLVSALTRRQERAVAAVPLLILPQILFSEFTLPRKYLGQLAEKIEYGMIARWGFRIFEEAAAAKPGYGEMIWAMLILLLMTVGLLGATIGVLKLSRTDKFL